MTGRRLLLPLAAALLALPWGVGGYVTYLLTLTFIYALVAIGMNLLTGLAGQISLGHAAFFAIGAYATGLLTQRGLLPFPLALLAAALLSTGIGALAALPALRLRNLYLAIATLGFGTVVQKALFEWRGLTGGGAGLELAPPHIAGLVLNNGRALYYVALAVLALGLWCAGNVARMRTGRAMLMLRDSEIAAGTLGIGIARFRVAAFALSTFYAAIAGGLYAYLVRYINPESFGLGLSISFLGMVVVGGLGSRAGPVLGAVFFVLLPEAFRGIKDAPGLVFGLALVLAMIFLPRGLAGIAPRSWRLT